MCDALIQDPNNVTYRASMQRITAYGTKVCSRKSVELVGHLSLCKVHAQLAREGLVDKDGRVAVPADIRNVRKYPKQFPNGLYRWLVDLNEP